ncbi:MAG: hypothetical protein ACJAZ0_001786 [Halioglobus sp.]|jgi:hypothetical protein
MVLNFLKLCIGALNTIMALRAFQSGTVKDHLLGPVLIIGLILFFTISTSFSAYWLMACAGAYLVSQIITSARPLSRDLPVLAGVLC